MLTDSDPYVPDEIYEYDPQFTQWPEENITELLNKPYPMENWCIPFSKEGANKQVISSQADSLIKISRIWADFFPANTSNQPI